MEVTRIVQLQYTDYGLYGYRFEKGFKRLKIVGKLDLQLMKFSPRTDLKLFKLFSFAEVMRLIKMHTLRYEHEL